MRHLNLSRCSTLRGACSVALLLLPLAQAVSQQSPDDELARLRPAEGIEVQLFAAEPLVINPAAIDVDALGRVWVAEIQFYRKFADQPPSDRIKVLEDTDGDGRADRATVFADGLYCPMSICVAGENVFVATSPDLWMFTDADGDLRADGPPRKLLTGFGGYNHDHGAHSLVLGPDHKWWMSHGDGGFDVTGTDGSRAAFRWGGVLRGELDGSRLELVAQNFRNPYEVCISSLGEAFLSDNDNDGNQSTRICWLLEGGDYGWFGHPPERPPADTPGAEGWHFRAHQLRHVPGTLVTGFGSPAGMCFYEGSAFGSARSGVPWHCDPGPREVRIYPHEPRGMAYTASQANVLAVEGDDYFRPDDICAAPDGTLLVSDWYDGGVGGHAYNNPDQGRIFRLVPRSGAPRSIATAAPNLASPARAIEALASANLATQFLARRALLSQGAAAVQALAEVVAGGDVLLRARALWVLDRIGSPSRELVLRELESDDPRFRALALRILRRHGETYRKPLSALADDADAQVRRELLLAARQWRDSEGLALVAKLVAVVDPTDRYALEAAWVAAQGRETELVAVLKRDGPWPADRLRLLELLAPEEAVARMVALVTDAETPLEARATALAALANRPEHAAAEAVIAQAGDSDAPPDLRQAAVAALGRNLSGAWSSLAGENHVAVALTACLADARLATGALQVISRLARADLSGPVCDLACDERASHDNRRAALETLASLGTGDPARLEPLADESSPVVRRAALSALLRLQHWSVFKRLLAPQENDELQHEALEVLLPDQAGAAFVLNVLESATEPPVWRDHALARAAALSDPQIRTLFDKWLPPAARPRTLGDAFEPSAILAHQGNAARGAEVFLSQKAACQKCHSIRGHGGSLGPDLSQIGRKYARDALLETIVQPSKAIAPEYVPVLIETASGRVHVGFLVERTAEYLLLRNAQDQLVRVAASEVVATLPQAKSLMPELLLSEVTLEDAADLLAYLVSLREPVQPVGRFRILGPFDNGDGAGLEQIFSPEAQLATVPCTLPDFDLPVAIMAERPARWEICLCRPVGGMLSVDTVALDRTLGFRGDRVTHYALALGYSPREQDVTLQVRSDDGVKLWLNGQLVHHHAVRRAIGASEDRVSTRFVAGRNVVLMKVENLDGPGGLGLSSSSNVPIDWRTE